MMHNRTKSRQDMEEERILEMLRNGNLLRVLDLVEKHKVAKVPAERAIERYREEQGSLWRQLRHVAFG